MYIKLFGNKSPITHHFLHHFSNDDHSIGLVSFYSTHLIPNVTEKNNKLYYDQSILTIPTGQYDFYSLSQYIKKNVKIGMKMNKIKNMVEFNTANINIDKENNICKLLGYNNKTPFIPVETVNVHCNLANGFVTKGGPLLHEETDIISTFKLSTPFRESIIYEPKNILYFPVQHNQIINIDIKITDENRELIDFGGANITVILHLKSL